MGYNLVIGERIEAVGDDDYPWAASVELPDAPAFGEPTDHTNERWPSYSSWATFSTETGLDDLFGWTQREDSPLHLMPEHPGLAEIVPAHLKRLDDAYCAYMSKNPTATPGFEDGEDGTLARLVWLRYWVRWSLANCDNPVFANS